MLRAASTADLELLATVNVEFSEQTPLGVVRTTLDFAAAGAPAGQVVAAE